MRKLQISLDDEAWRKLEEETAEVNRDFKLGSISLSDVACEMILSSKIDLRTLQAKHTNVRKSLRMLAAEKDLNFDKAIQRLQDLKGRATKKSGKQLGFQDGAT